MGRLAISEDEKQFFLEKGYLIVREALEAEELQRVRAAMDELTEYGRAAVRDNPDYSYGAGHRSGRPVLKRIEYVLDKRDACKILLGNPFILRSTEMLMGKDLFPTWDAMVLKLPGEGIVVPWHRDAGTGCVGDQPIFNVDFYLDAADEDTCVWVIPGSHRWSEERTREWLAAQPKEPGRSDFALPEAVPALMQPGDVLFHNILLLHGSPANDSEKLRRVVYYEFRAAHVEAALGPHVPAYIPVKQKMLLACIAKRQAADYIPADEVPYVYDPPAPYDTTFLLPGEEPATYRYPHGDYWRPGAWTPTLSLQVKGVGQVRPSPDGRRVAYTVTSAVMTDEKSEYVSQIHLADVDGGDSYQATFAEKSSRDPHWSPDGRWIAFTSDRADKSNLYRMRADGGEAEKLTDVKTGVGAFAWSPDGKEIAFVMAEAKDEAEEKRDKGRDDWRWMHEDPKRCQLYLLPVEKDLAGRREPRPLTPPTLHVAGGFDWSPDGKEIA
ncbi:MAG TPA: phytanoyl-CoA dioxygenase family protein, partial [Chthonomonadaceae bacterium]|nr:phytanoyl-CoA dioxygenase family protein [Chthonomonadaceae bacterium]